MNNQHDTPACTIPECECFGEAINRLVVFMAIAHGLFDNAAGSESTFPLIDAFPIAEQDALNALDSLRHHARRGEA